MKLDDLEKKRIYNVPDGYFDQLPSRIQQRITVDSTQQNLVSVRYALPVVVAVILLLLIWWGMPSTQTQDVDSILASVATEDLVAYLDNSEITTEDILEEGNFDLLDAEQIEAEVFEVPAQDEQQLDEILDNIDVEDF